MNYYSDNDPYCAHWLYNLIQANLIPPGHIDTRPIQDVRPRDLAKYTQCHFFAGIAGWPLALRLANIGPDVPLWTGSCPCQPFSAAGLRRGFADERHLWPHWFHLISVCKPSTIFGEQVTKSADWLRLVRGDLEAVGYAVGAMPIEAASAGAFQLRDRYWFVARSCGAELRDQSGRSNGANGKSSDVARDDSQEAIDLASSSSKGLEEPEGFASDARSQQPSTQRDGAVGMEHGSGDGWGEGWTEHEFRSRGFTAAVASFRGSQFVECPDGKWRPLPPPRVRWLGNEIPARVAKLRALGNAIVPQVAAEFLTAALAGQEASK